VDENTPSVEGKVEIPRGVLELILHASRSSYPNEFAALLRGEGMRIKEALLLPGTLQGRRSASINLNMLPIDSRSIGSVHSHPSGNTHPSEADLLFFSKRGNVNLIVGYPYESLNDVSAYDSRGEGLGISVIE
jgi:proteasome lid subunit RPN8/RPN11